MLGHAYSNKMIKHTESPKACSQDHKQLVVISKPAPDGQPNCEA